MSDRPVPAYRKLVLRTARIRFGKRVRVAGLPAILFALAALVWACCAGIALVLFGIAAIVAAAAPARRSTEPTTPALPRAGSGEPEALVRERRPGLLP